jgi:hypothetical protein
MPTCGLPDMVEKTGGEAKKQEILTNKWDLSHN